MLFRAGRVQIMRRIPEVAPHGIVEERVAHKINPSLSPRSDLSAHDRIQTLGTDHAGFKGVHVQIANHDGFVVLTCFLLRPYETAESWHGLRLTLVILEEFAPEMHGEEQETHA